MRLIKNIIEIN